MNKNISKLKQIAIILLFIIIIASGSYFNAGKDNQTTNIMENNKISYEISDIPKYSGETYVEINNNITEFSAEEMKIEDDYYSNLENGKVRNGNDKN